MSAFLQPNLCIVSLLLKSGADNGSRDALLGLTPVGWAHMFAIKKTKDWSLKPDHRQSNAIVKLLSSNLDSNPDLEQPQVLLAAAGRDDKWMDTVLAGGGVDVNQRAGTSLEGATPLILAVFTREENSFNGMH